MILTPGHAWRSRTTSNFKIAQSVLRRIDIARTQIAHQQLLAAQNVKRQKAPVAVVTVKKAPFLLAVNSVVGRVEVEDQLGRGRLETGNELLDQHARHRPRALPISPIFQPA